MLSTKSRTTLGRRHARRSRRALALPRGRTPPATSELQRHVAANSLPCAHYVPKGPAAQEGRRRLWIVRGDAHSRDSSPCREHNESSVDGAPSMPPCHPCRDTDCAAAPLTTDACVSSSHPARSRHFPPSLLMSCARARALSRARESGELPRCLTVHHSRSTASRGSGTERGQKEPPKQEALPRRWQRQ